MDLCKAGGPRGTESWSTGVNMPWSVLTPILLSPRVNGWLGGDGACLSSSPWTEKIAVQNINAERGTVLPTQQVRWVVGPVGRPTAGAQDWNENNSSRLRSGSCQSEDCRAKSKGTPHVVVGHRSLFYGALSAGVAKGVSTQSNCLGFNLRWAV